MVNVSFDDAEAFVAWLNQLPAEPAAGRTYRLPTEEEWGVCSPGRRRKALPLGRPVAPLFSPDDAGNFGRDEANGAHFSWEFLHGYRDPYLGTSPVGRFSPNPYFLYDMAGNTYEWTSSSYLPYPGTSSYAHVPGGKPYSSSLKVVRGSSWADELPKVLRCAFRNPMTPDTRMPFLGFRVLPTSRRLSKPIMSRKHLAHAS